MDYTIDNRTLQLMALGSTIVDGDHAVPSLLSAHEALRPYFEGIIWQRHEEPEVVLAAQMTAHCVLMCKTVQVLGLADEFSSSFMYLRSLEETASNLFYVLYAGPAEEGRPQGELAQQFLDYRYVDQSKLINKEKPYYEAKYAGGWVPPWPDGPRTMADYELHQASVNARREKVIADYGLPRRPKSWHGRDKETRTANVLNHLPNFVTDPIRQQWISLHESTTIFNTQVHGGPMLFFDTTMPRKGRALELQGSGNPDLNWAGSAAFVAEACWYALGDLMGELALVQEEIAKAKVASAQDILKENGRVFSMGIPLNQESALKDQIRRRRHRII